MNTGGLHNWICFSFDVGDPIGHRLGIREHIVGLGNTFSLRSTATIYFSASPRGGYWNLSEVMQRFGYLHMWAEFRPAKRGYRNRLPYNLCVMLDRWVFFGVATQSRAIKSQAHFSTSMGGLPLLHPFNRGRLPLVVEHWLLRFIVPHGHVKKLSQVVYNRWLSAN